jgi:hypothetical protein
MSIEIYKHIEVNILLYRFSGTKKKCKWNNKVYKVTQMMNSWNIPDGDGFSTHFVVLCKENDLLCELSFNHTDLKWELMQYDSLN